MLRKLKPYSLPDVRQEKFREDHCISSLVHLFHVPRPGKKNLGLLLDKRITLNQHIENVVNKTAQASRILYSLLNRKSHLSTQNKLLLYKIVLRPIMTYAAPVLLDSIRTHIKKLQKLQNKLLKMCLDSPWRFSTRELHKEADIEMISDFRERLTLNFTPCR